MGHGWVNQMGCLRASVSRWVMLLLVLGCVVGVAPALGVVGQFGEEGSGAGQFNEPRAIVVDNGDLLADPSAEDVYIADRNNNRVDKFSSEGVFLLAWGWGVADGQARLETCGPQSSHPECQPGIKGEGSGQFAEPSGVAVDSVSGPSQGDVYVEDVRNHRVQKFEPDGEFVLMFGEEVNETTKGDVCLAGEKCKEGVEAPGPVHGGFQRLSPDAIAVDSEGTVYVGDKSRVQEFNEGGAFTGETKLAVAGSGLVEGLAVDNASPRHLYVGGEESPPGVHEYELPSGAEVLPVRDESGRQDAIAVGPNNELFVDDRAVERILEFNQAGVEVASLPRHSTEGAKGLAYGTANRQLYLMVGVAVHVIAGPLPGPLVEVEQATVEPVGSASLTAGIDPENEQTEYVVEYGVQGSGETTSESVMMTANQFEAEVVTVKLKGLLPNVTYNFHFVARNAAGMSAGAVQSFTTLPGLSIDSESVSQVTATSARLAGTLNPFTVPTHYRFQYGSEACASAVHECVSVPVPEGYAGEGLGDVPFSVLVEGLTPGSVYHYRVVAVNECEPVANPGRQCTVDGTDRVFSTQSGEGSGLIDGRGWEMVSPPDKHGASLEVINEEGGDIQAAENGGGLAYVAKAPVTSGPAGSRSFVLQQLLATRSPGGVWSTREIATPHEAVAAIGPGGLSEYKLFSPDLSSAVVEPAGSTPLSATASERTPYVRDNSACEATSSEVIAAGCYTPLVTLADDTAEPFEAFGDSEAQGGLRKGTGVEFVTATTDLSHVLLGAPQSLVKEFHAGASEEETSLYEWAGGRLEPVSVLPDGVSAVTEAATGTGARVGADGESMRNAVSADGERVFFQIQPKNTIEVRLFLRDMARGETVRVDSAQGVKQPATIRSTFLMANTAGSRVFFESAGRLTADSTASEVLGSQDLYVFEVTSEPGEALAGRLTDLSVEANPLQSAGVGGVIGASEDGSVVYFYASGAPLVGGAPQGLDVYMERYDEGTGTWTAPRFIASLAGADGQGLSSTVLADLAARVSPNGRFLAFMSQASVTGYDNRDARSGQPDEEVYEYDADSERLVCVSCDPSGGRPAGVFDGDNEIVTKVPVLLVDRSTTWWDQWLAGSIPGWTPTQEPAGVSALDVSLYQSRYLTNEGRLFFDSPADLVPAAGNGREDVYEFEPGGLGGCSSSVSSASVVYVKELVGKPVEGCVGLISSGTSAEESAFLDAGGVGPGGSEGEDVFFVTGARLSSADTDSALDVYDAHVCSAVSPCPSGTVTVAPACSDTESCRAAPAPEPEVFGAPSSATFSGPGDVSSLAGSVSVAVKKPKTAAEVRAEKLARALKVCRKDKKQGRRVACEKKARKAYGVKASARRSGKSASRKAALVRGGGRGGR